jgi:type I restriction enzyme S subunit
VTYTKGDALSAGNTGTIPILRANNIQAQTFDWNDLVHVPESLVSKDQELQIGDVVIATSSGSLSVVGKAAQVRSEIRASFGAFCGVLRPHPQIQARYYGHFFSSAHYRSAVSDLARGVNINNLKRDHFQAIQIPIAPLAEQKRIADKLDTVLTRVDAVNTRLARVAPLLKRFRQSVLAAATSGRLTEDWRGGIETSYAKAPMRELAEMRLGKMLDKAKNTGVLVRYLRNVNVRWFGFDLSDLSELRIESHERDGLSIRDGDLLICEGGEPGRCAIWQGGETDLIFQKALHRVRVQKQKLLPEWVAYVLKSLCDSGEITQLFTGSTIKHLTGTALARIEIPLPSLEEQTEIVRRVETLFAFADRLEARLAQAQTAATRLTPALLAKAFRGELVPQDPNDEPAAELLRRLQAERASAPKASTGRGRKAAVQV